MSNLLWGLSRLYSCNHLLYLLLLMYKFLVTLLLLLIDSFVILDFLRLLAGPLGLSLPTPQ